MGWCRLHSRRRDDDLVMMCNDIRGDRTSANSYIYKFNKSGNVQWKAVIDNRKINSNAPIDLFFADSLIIAYPMWSCQIQRINIVSVT